MVEKTVPAVVNTSGGICDASSSREDVALHNAICSKGSTSASAPVDVVGTCASS